MPLTVMVYILCPSSYFSPLSVKDSGINISYFNAWMVVMMFHFDSFCFIVYMIAEPGSSAQVVQLPRQSYRRTGGETRGHSI